MQSWFQRFTLTLLVLLTAAMFTGCATGSLYRRPTKILLPTDQSTSQVFRNLGEKIAQYHYKIAVEDMNVGLLVTAPRQFSFMHDGRKILARQVVQVRQEGGAVKLRLAYDCAYQGNQIFSPCLADDADANRKISHIDRGFIALVKHALRGSDNVVETPAPISRTTASAPKTVAPKSNPFSDWGTAAQ